jgi:brefeldin A-inhibited guanine nucleotide-exchange protein
VIQSSSYKLESQEDTCIKNIALECVFNMLKSLTDYVKLEDKTPANGLNNDPNQIEAPIEAVTEEVQSGNYEQMLFEKNKISTAVLKFNMKPKAGIAYLLANKMIASEPDDIKIADILKFIKENPDIDKGKIGEFFGEKDEFNKKALYNFIESLDFRNLEFVESVRVLFAEFRPVGESQIIDRILVKFGEKYSKDNPNKFVNAAVPYELSYAVMILQTNNHSPQIKKKLTLVLTFIRLTFCI